jgi:DNA-nicking Smr family endonuclease
MSRRKIRPEELDLWRKVARTADRLHPEAQNLTGADPRKPALTKPKPAAVPAFDPIPDFEIGQNAHSRGPSFDLLAPVRDRVAKAPVAMDRKAFDRMKRGKLEPEGRIDLHGMTLDQAHTALLGFILRSQSMGRRLVLVITGKGKRDDSDNGPIPRRRGVLRHQVPDWLRSGPMAAAVLQVSEAHLKHGGGGAYYVYLRRNR